jgi:hypothetical protein
VAGHPDHEVPGERVVSRSVGSLHRDQVVPLCPLVLPQIPACIGGQPCGIRGGVQDVTAELRRGDLPDQRDRAVEQTGDTALQLAIGTMLVDPGPVPLGQPA